MAIAVLLPPTTMPVSAETGDRTLYLYHTHTHETARITFKRHGVYDQKGLQQLDWFLRDWRNNQPTEMAPQLFDLVWEVYQKTGATQPINIVSAYRSPVTNAYLHSRSNGVAVHSQHMLGHAMDYFIPGVPLAKLRAVGMQQQVGGIGFYPNSGSPFVHMDVGTVRAWPRMTTAQLAAIFPDGKTIHVPSNGKVLSQSGYAYAQGQWNACHAVPCTNSASLKGGALSLGHDTMVAAATTSATGKTFTDIFHGVNPGAPQIGKPIDDSSDDDVADAQESAGPAQTSVATIAVSAPIPMDRPATLLADVGPASQPTDPDIPATLAAAAATPFDSLFPDAYAPGMTPPAGAGSSSPAPVPAQKSYGLMVATGELPRSARPQNALGAIASIETPIPAARLARDDGDANIVSAYASIGPGTPGEQQLESIINNETAGSIAMAASGGTGLTNTVSSPIGSDALKSYAADRRNDPTRQSPARIAVLASFKSRDTHFVAPGFASALVQPVAMNSGTFAVFVEPNPTDLSPATELGPMVGRFGFRTSGAPPLNVARFAPANSLLVASR